jgi:hypothetical protein
VLHDLKGDLIGQVIRNGRPQKGMPAFSLTQVQITGIAAYLHSKTHLAANRFTYVISGLVTGDAKNGEAFFNGAGKCNTCQPATKDLTHIASKYDPVVSEIRIALKTQYFPQSRIREIRPLRPRFDPFNIC